MRNYRRFDDSTSNASSSLFTVVTRNMTVLWMLLRRLTGSTERKSNNALSNEFRLTVILL